MNELTDEELVREVLAGSRAAGNELFGRYLPRVRAYAYKILRNHELAADAAATVLMEAFKGLAGFDATREFEPWILKIVQRAAWREGERSLRHQSVAWDEIRISEFASGDLAPTDEVETNELRDALYLCMERLDEQESELLRLRHFSGLSYRAISAVLGVSKSKIAEQINAVEQKIGACLREKGFDPAFTTIL